MNKPVISSRLIMGILFVPALLALVIVTNGSAQAQTPSTETVMVSNAGKSHNLEVRVSNNLWYAQSFCTGGTYTTLKKVRIYASDPYRMNPSVALHSGRGGSPPGTHLLTLTNPTSFDSSYSTPDDFTTTGYQLAPNTLYWIVVKKAVRASTGWFRVSATRSNGLDGGGGDGWSLGRMLSNWYGPMNERMRIAVSVDTASPSHRSARFPRSCKEEDYPSTVRTVYKGTAANTVIATIAAADPDGDTLTYSLTGPDAEAFDDLFAFNTATGKIRVKEGVTVDYRYVSRSRYSLRVNVTDGEDESGNAESQATIDDHINLRINISNRNVPGTITISTNSPVVGTPITPSVYDPNGRIVNGVFLWGMGPSPTGPFTLLLDASPTYTPVEQDVGKFLKVWAVYWVEGNVQNDIEILVLENPVAVAGAVGSGSQEEDNNDDEQTQNQESSTNTNGDETPLTARADGLPDSHTGDAFTFELHFSEESPLSYATLRDNAFTVNGGTVTKARRLEAGKNVRWEITVDPSGNADVSVSLPVTTDCDSQGAICTGDGRRLSNGLALLVPGPDSDPPPPTPDPTPTPLTARTAEAPAQHDGAAFTFELRFSETPADGFSYKTLRDHAFTATGGEVVKARRLEPGKNVRWEITVRPDGDGTVTIVLPVTEDCASNHAICTADGRPLSNRLELTVAGPDG